MISSDSILGDGLLKRTKIQRNLPESSDLIPKAAAWHGWSLRHSEKGTSMKI